MNTRFYLRYILIVLLFSNALAASAQTETPPAKKKKIVGNGEFYLSWGYNHEWYTKSDIHISQPDMNNDYKFDDLRAKDHIGWDKQLLKKDITIPQYNYRIGYFFNEAQTWGLEINFDHTKYVVIPDREVRIKGTYEGRQVDSLVKTGETTFKWQLNNGANFLELNLVRKLPLIDAFKSRFQFVCLLKAGAGPVIPHVENTVFGKNNRPGFQFGGWNVDADVSFRATFFKHVFLEYANKVVYARYSQLQIYNGLAKQAFGCYEMFLCVGASFRL